jgi:hypothetical protein
MIRLFNCSSLCRPIALSGSERLSAHGSCEKQIHSGDVLTFALPAGYRVISTESAPVVGCERGCHGRCESRPCRNCALHARDQLFRFMSSEHWKFDRRTANSTRKPVVFMISAAIEAPAAVPLWFGAKDAATIPNTMRPSTSSTTAAPRMNAARDEVEKVRVFEDETGGKGADARPTRLASHAITKQQLRLSGSSTPVALSRAAHVNNRGTAVRPITMAPKRNTAAANAVFPTPIQDRGSPRLAEAIAPLTMPRMINPSTSSTTAAPRTMRASIRLDAPRSRSARAVMPTLVALNVAPRNAWTYGLAPGQQDRADSPSQRERNDDA